MKCINTLMDLSEVALKFCLIVLPHDEPLGRLECSSLIHVQLAISVPAFRLSRGPRSKDQYVRILQGKNSPC